MPSEQPTPHASDHRDQFELATQLRSRFHEFSARFLLTELQAGLTLLNVAETSRHAALNERRRALALEAYEVVVDRLARIYAEPITLTDEELDEIERLRQDLKNRLGR